MIALKDIRYFALSDIGLKRSRNEDTYYIHDSQKAMTNTQFPAIMLAVADGMGGHNCGDLASSLACQKLSGFIEAIIPDAEPKRIVKQIEHWIFAIDSSIRQEGNRNPKCIHMGSTLSTLLIAEDFGVVAHVGDSRIYRLRRNRFEQLTTDHTFVQEMIEEGELTVESASTHPFRNMLTGVVGTPEPLEKVETHIIDFKTGDRWLLSTDGLHGLVSSKEIQTTLKRQRTPRQAAQKLIDTALQQGGKDNVTVIVIYI